MITPFIKNSTESDKKKIDELDIQKLLTSEKPVISGDLTLKLDTSREIKENTENNIIKKEVIQELIPFKPLDNELYFTKGKTIKSMDVIQKIGDTLNLSLPEQDLEIIEKPELINRLLNNNKRVTQLEKFVRDPNLKTKISNIKDNLANLQFNLMTKPKKQPSVNLLNEVIENINNKVVNINEILENNIQTGGNSFKTSYKYKYLKYKSKYFTLLSKIK